MFRLLKKADAAATVRIAKAVIKDFALIIRLYNKIMENIFARNYKTDCDIKQIIIKCR